MIIAILIFVMIAAACNAIMDTCETSISFKASKLHGKWNIMFWCKPIAADHKRFFWVTEYRMDGWHIMKSTMIVCWALALTLMPMLDYTGSGPLWLQMLVTIVCIGVAWNRTFNLLYKFLKTKSSPQ